MVFLGVQTNRVPEVENLRQEHQQRQRALSARKEGGSGPPLLAAPGREIGTSATSDLLHLGLVYFVRSYLSKRTIISSLLPGYIHIW